MKEDKNYYRLELIGLEAESSNGPLIFTGKYKHTKNQEWVTFTTIRKYIPGVKTQTVCNHINIRRSIVSKYLRLSEKEHNRKFYICGNVSTYNHYGDLRGCILLKEDMGLTPIWLTHPTMGENQRIIERIYRELTLKKCS